MILSLVHTYKKLPFQTDKVAKMVKTDVAKETRVNRSSSILLWYVLCHNAIFRFFLSVKKKSIKIRHDKHVCFDPFLRGEPLWGVGLMMVGVNEHIDYNRIYHIYCCNQCVPNQSPKLLRGYPDSYKFHSSTSHLSFQEHSAELVDHALNIVGGLYHLDYEVPLPAKNSIPIKMPSEGWGIELMQPKTVILEPGLGNCL